MTITKGMTKSEGGRFLVNLELRDQAQVQADTHTEEQVRNFNLMRQQKEQQAKRRQHQQSESLEKASPGLSLAEPPQMASMAASHRMQQQNSSLLNTQHKLQQKAIHHSLA